MDERLAMKKPEVLRVVKCCLPAILFDDKRKKASEDASAINIDLQVDDLQVTTLCRLWAGMGLIYRVRISLPVGSTTSGNRTTGNDEIAIKHIIPPPSSKRSFGDHRKASSYRVEANFYENLAQELIAKGVSVPTPYHVERGKGDSVIIAMSYHESKVNPTENQQRVRLVLSWLAQFHAMYWDADAADRVVQQAGLQAVGSYWYLATRPDEHEEMPDHGWQGRLKRAARAIDARLQRDPLQCVIHGDAKDANILMDEHGKVTFCDFQYARSSLLFLQLRINRRRKGSSGILLERAESSIATKRVARAYLGAAARFHGICICGLLSIHEWVGILGVGS